MSSLAPLRGRLPSLTRRPRLVTCASQYIATDLRNELDLVDRMRPKPTATIEDFGTILGAIWSEPAQFRFPRLVSFPYMTI